MVEKTTITLLIFTRNDLDAALERIHSYGRFFDSVMLLDSSDPVHYSVYSSEIINSGAAINRAIPLGDTDLLRPFASSLMRTDRVFELDTDERISSCLLENIHDFDMYEACSIARNELDLNTYRRLLRLYNPKKLRFDGPSFSFPLVDGAVGFPSRKFCIMHDAVFSSFLESRSRRDRYFTIESLERPFTGQYLANSLTIKFGKASVRPLYVEKLIGDPDKPLARPAVMFSLLLESLSELFMGGSPSWAIFRLKYGIQKLRYMEALPVEERTLRNSVAAEIRAYGGLVRYLGLDNPSVVKQLTETYDWKSSVSAVISYLSYFRYRNGHPAAAMST